MSIATPLTAHLNDPKYANAVYEPSEDTFLLIDALEQDLPFLQGLTITIVCEIGTGSGIVITAISKALGSGKFYLASDINPKACSCASQTAEVNSVDLEIIRCDLLTCFTDRLSGSVDLLIFNPPYVVTTSEELRGSGLNRSWAGGTKGRDVLDRLLNDVPKLLSCRGVFYLVALPENDIDEIEQFFKRFHFEMFIVLNRKAGRENLFVLRFSRENAGQNIGF